MRALALLSRERSDFAKSSPLEDADFGEIPGHVDDFRCNPFEIDMIPGSAASPYERQIERMAATEIFDESGGFMCKQLEQH